MAPDCIKKLQKQVVLSVALLADQKIVLCPVSKEKVSGNVFSRNGMKKTKLVVFVWKVSSRLFFLKLKVLDRKLKPIRQSLLVLNYAVVEVVLLN